MLRVKLYCVGKLKEHFWLAAEKEYQKRLGKFLKLDVTEIPEILCMDEKNPSLLGQVKKAEGEKILSHLTSKDFLVALDAGGRLMSSEEWSGWLKKEMSGGVSLINMTIGGSYGLSPEVLHRANLVWSFSRLTFPHQMMRVMVLEQIYRGFKIMSGESYHK